jgi:3-dehydroquinate synthase
MSYASQLSEKLLGFRNKEKVTALLEKYGLPTSFAFDKEQVIGVMKMDKKKENGSVNFILLEKIGKAIVQPVTIRQIFETF